MKAQRITIALSLLLAMLAWVYLTPQATRPAGSVAEAKKSAPISVPPSTIIAAPVLPAQPAPAETTLADAKAQLLKLLAQKEASNLTPDQRRALMGSHDIETLTAKSRAQEQSLDDIKQLVASMTPEDRQALYSWVQSSPDIPNADRNSTRNWILMGWAENDPISAAAFAEGLGPGEMNMVADDWSKTDSKAAFAWAESLPEGLGRERAVDVSLYRLANLDAPAAWEIATTHFAPGQYGSFLGHIIIAWGEKDPAAAADALTSVTHGALRAKWGTSASNVNLMPNLRNVSDLLLMSWMRQDPQAAADWVASLPEGPLHATSAECLGQLQKAYAIMKSSPVGVWTSTSSTIFVGGRVIRLHP